MKKYLLAAAFVTAINGSVVNGAAAQCTSCGGQPPQPTPGTTNTLNNDNRNTIGVNANPIANGGQGYGGSAISSSNPNQQNQQEQYSNQMLSNFAPTTIRDTGNSTLQFGNGSLSPSQTTRTDSTSSITAPLTNSVYTKYEAARIPVATAFAPPVPAANNGGGVVSNDPRALCWHPREASVSFGLTTFAFGVSAAYSPKAVFDKDCHDLYMKDVDTARLWESGKAGRAVVVTAVLARNPDLKEAAAEAAKTSLACPHDPVAGALGACPPKETVITFPAPK